MWMNELVGMGLLVEGIVAAAADIWKVWK